ncbi:MULTISPECIES: aminodeoxychorismate/anthranilate synthase component II [Halorussus]|uniref:anthranilate synthase component II n=1 Tax=Halorussus TaxID=1070314 RepID=UPI000E2115E6|nr:MULTISPECIES: aminodeoxychorismate/anthranilate synthase component II [Halorussus]NHN58934.1 aminodeoxychorismate/anthranilate synthase component II [Halorussus sp. JP-T4]
MSILVIDNYDSFVYNLVQYVGEFDPEVTVRRNDAVTVEAVRDLDPDGIVVSPGPGTPAEAGVSVPLFARTDYPVLGVCLGHQALCAAEGAPVGRAPEVVHGKSSPVAHDGEGVFAGLPATFEVGRYHSLAVAREDVPESLDVTAWTTGEQREDGSGERSVDRADDERGVVMGVRHRERPHVGVQFHPESVLTDVGERLVENFCELCGVR